jgi:hypothetical protein
MLFFRSKGVATPLLRKNRKKKTLNLQHYRKLDTLCLTSTSPPLVSVVIRAISNIKYLERDIAFNCFHDSISGNAKVIIDENGMDNRNIMTTERRTRRKTGLAKVAVHCSSDTFSVNQTLVLCINICGKNCHLCKHFLLAVTLNKHLLML